MNSRQLMFAAPVMALVFLVLDGLWLSTMAERLYRPAIGHLMAERPAVMAAVLFYVLYLVGAFVLALLPAFGAGDGGAASGEVSGAVWRGALFGFIAYATYDLTNQATLRDWPWHVTAIDLCWGAFVTACAVGAGAWAAVRYGSPS